MTTAQAARTKLNNKVASLSNEMLLDSIREISTRGEELEIVIVRVSLLNEYEARFGGEAADSLMDELGLWSE